MSTYAVYTCGVREPADADTAAAFGTPGVPLFSATRAVRRQVPAAPVLAAPGIASVVIGSPRDEALTSHLCSHTPQRTPSHRPLSRFDQRRKP
jgi:hypothetical protein